MPLLLQDGTNLLLQDGTSLLLQYETAGPIAFTGTISNQVFILGSTVNVDFSTYYTGAATPFTFALQTGSLPTGLSLSSAGVLTGTPTVVEVQSGLIIRGTDTSLNTADSNSFSISIVADAGKARNDEQFAALGALGYTGTIIDRTLQWLQDNGATSDNLPTAWSEMLESKGYGPPLATPTAWYYLLGSLGYTGALPKRDRDFWITGGTF